MEKNSYGDSLLFFRGDFVDLSDSIKSAGHNRNACISSLMYYFSQETAMRCQSCGKAIAAAGRHLYARLVAVDLGEGVKDKGNKINSFELVPEFPQPVQSNDSHQLSITNEHSRDIESV